MTGLILALLLNVALTHPLDTVFVASDSLVSDNLLNLGNHEGWRFHPGDDLRWANPDYDDDDWMLMKPIDLTEPIPDSLWPGYGWFRFRFSADSSIYNNPWTLYFFTWGAAEVYIDGKLVKSYGKFSSQSNTEKRYMPYQKLHPAFALAPDSSHVVAVRFSYHEASRYKKLLGKFSNNFGFGIGFSTMDFNNKTLMYKNISNRIVHISGAMLVVIILLHGFLFLLFPGEKSNLYIALISVLLLMHCITAFTHLFFEFDRLWYFIVRDSLFPLLFLLAVSLFPTTLSLMFNQKQKRIYRILIYITPVLALSILMLIENSLLPLGIFGLIIAALSAKVLIKAGRNGEKGVWFVATGFLGSLFSAFGIVIYEVIATNSSWAVESIFITLVYVSIPLGLTLFMAYRFYHLYAGLESKVIERTKELKESLDGLKATQTQLIQSEKMASLGELTAGIAHEIQNPLNFVNNFSEVSNELIDEMREELAKGKGQLANEIAGDIKQNLEKINHHGKRADAIVKGMLQHSRTSSGQKEPTDINVLANE
jgi:two-component system, NtrC family, sensor kinase